jgi:hypothetical protein
MVGVLSLLLFLQKQNKTAYFFGKINKYYYHTRISVLDFTLALSLSQSRLLSPAMIVANCTDRFE